MLLGGQEGPGGGVQAGEERGFAGVAEAVAEAVGGLAGEGALVVGGAGHDGEGHGAGDVGPVLPAGELDEVVGAHEPDELGAGKAAAEGAERIVGVARVEARLDACGDNPATVRDAAGAFEAVGEGGHAVGGFERVAGGDEEPNLVEPQALEGEAGNVAVALMGRVERAAEDADAGPAPIAPIRDGVWTAGDEGFQGRTWPVPVTT